MPDDERCYSEGRRLSLLISAHKEALFLLRNATDGRTPEHLIRTSIQCLNITGQEVRARNAIIQYRPNSFEEAMDKLTYLAATVIVTCLDLERDALAELTESISELKGRLSPE